MIDTRTSLIKLSPSNTAEIAGLKEIFLEQIFSLVEFSRVIFQGLHWKISLFKHVFVS